MTHQFGLCQHWTPHRMEEVGGAGNNLWLRLLCIDTMRLMLDV